MSCNGTCSQSNSPVLQPHIAANWHLPSPPEWLGGWLARLVDLQRRWRRHTELCELSDAQLRDVGLTREQVGREARRPFWT